MKHSLVGWLAAIFLGLANTGSAQIIAPEPFASLSSEPNLEMIEELKSAAGTLRLQPLNPREICHLWERYAAAEILERRLRQYPSLEATLGVPPSEAKARKIEEARRLAQALSIRLWQVTESQTCQYWVSLGSNTIFSYRLSMENDWEIASTLLRARKEFSFKDEDGVPSNSTLIGFIRDYIEDEGSERFRSKWLDGSWSAGQILMDWITEYRFPPSLMGLDANQTTKLFEEYGRK